MRYWIRNDGSSYTLSTEDLSNDGYIEITMKPELHSEIYKWDWITFNWVIDKEAAKVVVGNVSLQKQSAGLMFKGIPFKMDQRALVMFNMAAIECGKDNTISYPLKDYNGTMVTLSAEDVISLHGHIFTYLNGCVAREHELELLIESGELTAEIIDQNWPWNVIQEPVAE